MYSACCIRIARAAPALLLLPALAACARDMSFLAAHGTVAQEQRAEIVRIALVVGIVVVPAILLGPYVAWRYRYRGGARYTPRWDFSWPVEIALWGIPVVVALVLTVQLVGATLRLDPYAALPGDTAPLDVQVIGYDWKWLFVYPDYGIASAGELVWPADRPLRLELTSATVMQSFHIPRLGGQIYAMGGMRTEINLASDGPGTFGGQNTQYNGEGFWMQKFQARAVDARGWRAWLEEARNAGVPFDATFRAALARPGTTADLATALGSAGETDAELDGVPPGIVHARDVPPEFFASVMAEAGHAMPPVVAASAEGDAAEDARLAALLCGTRAEPIR